MGITVYSLLWVLQDFYHQPWQPKGHKGGDPILGSSHDCHAPQGSEWVLDVGRITVRGLGGREEGFGKVL